MDRAEGRSAFRPWQPKPPCAGGVHGDLELLLHCRLRDLSRLHRARAGTVARSHRAHVVDRCDRLPRRSRHGDAYRAALRDRPNDDCGRSTLGSCGAAPRTRTGWRCGDPVSDRRHRVVRILGSRLQHRAGQLPPGDLPAETPGADELRDALHRVGNDPTRDAHGRSARVADRAAGDDRRRCDRRRARCPLDRLLAAALPPRDARAHRRRRTGQTRAEPAPA